MDRVKIDMEFIFKASPSILYKFLTAPECLVLWFSEGCDVTEDEYVFSWEGDEEQAHIVDDIEEERLRFKFEDSDEGEYLEYRMYKSDITQQTILEITDFCDDGEEQEQKDWWSKQVSQLRIVCGG